MKIPQSGKAELTTEGGWTAPFKENGNGAEFAKAEHASALLDPAAGTAVIAGTRRD